MSSALVFYSNDLSSNPGEVYSFYFAELFEKVTRDGPFFKKICTYTVKVSFIMSLTFFKV